MRLLLVCLAIGSVNVCCAQGIVKGPYLMKPTPHGITVCWVSSSQCKGEVVFREDRPGESEQTDRTARDSKSTFYHRIRISGLKPYTTYSYHVVCDDSRSPIAAFRTAAEPGTPFRFIAYGDNRTQPMVHASVIERMRKFGPDFVIQTGDLVANGLNEAQWDEYWQVVKPLVREAPMYTSLGNHEGSGAPYFRFFDIPREYAFDYGDAHFIALDTNRPPSEFAAQEKWLKKELAQHQNARWRIVFFHHTPYTCVVMPDRRIAAAALRARLEPIFKAGNVQLIVCGHDHNYQHHFAAGIHYVVSGGGGAPLYDVRPDTPNVVTARKVYHHCEIVEEGDTLKIRAIQPDGTVIEQFDVHQATSRSVTN
jgi:3',5'-cyclic AMP phosphodiesterase CpdA